MKIRKLKMSESIKKVSTVQFLNKALYATVLLIMGACGIATADDKIYKIPPSSTTYSSVPYISDHEMEQCVRLYNEIRWLGDDIKNKQTTLYTQSAINSYKNLADRYSSMVNKFNCDCAGKQSESAYRAAQKLNNEQAGSSISN
ncbi:hypothetical protein SAMN02746065_1207 [Desulfocicer vacuolatum DSM 3385]|uniref:Uncharacterized protein n=1 Tax=Desulfocicer vacuolatum DSM 3385 TaxID=1121400 RepID=A0A1W2DRZ4_9BACT|nr:hypothetical protein [Desulfocicer vacuolatum]SMD00211.1 hypothetical protein SAMN02746065_1207 [Desulfocicer vacuolatum DSM 3385]